MYNFLYDLARGDALHFEYPTVVELDEDAVALIERDHQEAMQERRKYLRTFGYDPLDRNPKRPGPAHGPPRWASACAGYTHARGRRHFA